VHFATTHTTNQLHAFSAYRFHFNGKEADNEVYGEDNAYDFGARIYSSRLGIFMSIDPRTKDFPFWTPYLFAANLPTKYIDVNGEGPGDLFQSMDDAANDFGMLYNDNSINKDKEYGAYIYRVKIKGKIFYTYNKPTQSDVYNSVDINRKGVPLFKKVRAYVHSHSSYNIPSDNEFSRVDKEIADRKKQIAYVTTPNGSLKKYDPKTKETNTLNQSLPSDPRDPTNNGNDARNYPSNEPQQDQPIYLLPREQRKESDSK
jgi:RHS repeat-associated protein